MAPFSGSASSFFDSDDSASIYGELFYGVSAVVRFSGFFGAIPYYCNKKIFYSRMALCIMDSAYYYGLDRVNVSMGKFFLSYIDNSRGIDFDEC